MEQKTEIHAVELVRRIRDEQAELLQGKSDEEIMNFFRRAGEAARSSETRGKGRGGEPALERDA
ncbi:MAG: hypothetical protein AB1578_05745 [Thermodesulfobacteriota bacterium]|jgi:hypothetical protein